MAKNLKVVAIAFGWPVGAVLPPHALANAERHLEIGSVVETHDPVTVDVAPSPSTWPPPPTCRK
jgi:hypothetical protein